MFETRPRRQASPTAADPKRKKGGDVTATSSKRPKYDGNEARKFPEDLGVSSSDEEEEEEEERDDVTAHVNQFFAELHVEQSRQRKRLMEGATVKVQDGPETRLLLALFPGCSHL